MYIHKWMYTVLYVCNVFVHTVQGFNRSQSYGSHLFTFCQLQYLCGVMLLWSAIPSYPILFAYLDLIGLHHKHFVSVVSNQLLMMDCSTTLDNVQPIFLAQYLYFFIIAHCNIPCKTCIAMLHLISQSGSKFSLISSVGVL